MIFMDPKTDIGFKKLFGDNKRKNILISFLNSVLERKDGEMITEVNIMDPNNNRELLQEKFSTVDVRCKDQANKTYIIEMQMLDRKDFMERSQYYTSLTYSRQLKKCDTYHQLTPVIFVGVLDFNIFTSPEYLSHHLILNSKTHEYALCHLEFHFLELPKFDKKVDELEGLVDKWIYILKNASQLNIIPQTLKKPAVLEDAMESLEQGTWTDEDLYNYDKYLDAIRNEAGALKTAMEHGIETGMRKNAIENAKKMLSHLDIKIISQITGLSIEEIESLKKG